MEKVVTLIDAGITMLNASLDDSKDSFYDSLCGLCSSFDLDSGVNIIKDVIITTALKTLARNEKIKEFLNDYGISYDLKRNYNIRINDLCESFAKAFQRDEKDSNDEDKCKYFGVVYVYVIFKDKSNENRIKEIEGKSEEYRENYFKENFELKYEGGFNFVIPNIANIFNFSKSTITNFLKDGLFKIELNGEIVISEKMVYNFICDGKSTISFEVDKNMIWISQKCHNCIFLENGEYYKGDLINFEKNGKGYYINKDGIGIKGSFIDNNTIDGEAIIYDRNHKEIGKTTCSKKKIHDVIEEFFNKN